MGLFSKLKAPLQSLQGNSPKPNSNYAPPSPPRQQQHINPDSRVLPTGWISQFDPSSQKFFYVYTPTGLRQWEHPADKPMSGNRGENSSYANQSQQPYYPQQQQQQQQQRLSQQPVYGQSQYGQPQYGQPQYVQQPMGGQRMGGGGGGMGMGKMAAVGVGGGLMGYMVGDALMDDHQPDIIENNYYGDNGGGMDGGGMDGGGFDGGGFDGGGFDDF